MSACAANGASHFAALYSFDSLALKACSIRCLLAARQGLDLFVFGCGYRGNQMVSLLRHFLWVNLALVGRFDALEHSSRWNLAAECSDHHPSHHHSPRSVMMSDCSQYCACLIKSTFITTDLSTTWTLTPWSFVHCIPQEQLMTHGHLSLLFFSF